MNQLMRITNAVLDFVIINIIAVPLIANPLALAWYGLCVALAFLLRLGMEHREKHLTFSSVLYQSITTVSWSFFAVLVWNTFLSYDKGFEIYLFVNALFASYMVAQFEETFKLGLKKWLRIKLGKFLAVEKGEEKP